eukprot:1000144-Ditylum_brightwellii.AAC.1
MVGLARRKISSSGRNDVELGEPSAPAVDVENSGASDQTNEEQKDNSCSIISSILTVLIVLVLLVDGYWIATPEATKVEQLKQLVEYSDSFHEAKEALYKQI